VNLVDRIRASISDGTFADLRADFLGRYYRSDPLSPSQPAR
jgi:queuine tRNA-ribosyltransferase